MGRPVRLIVNPRAGGGRAARLLPGVEAALDELGLRVLVQRTTSITHARVLAREAASAGAVAAAMGGDGLIGAVAGELRGGVGVLAVLPGGRGNDFARKLGIGVDPVAACAHIAAGRERRVDVAEAAGVCYVGILSAGLDSDVQVIANATEARLGRLVYLYGTLRALRTWRPARWEVVVDGERRSFTGYSVAVANSGVYGGGMRLVPDAELDDGLLDVALSADRPRQRFLLGLARVFRGAHVHEPGFELLRGREVTVAADRPFMAFADGDPVAELPTTVRVHARTLRVLAP